MKRMFKLFTLSVVALGLVAATSQVATAQEWEVQVEVRDAATGELCTPLCDLGRVNAVSQAQVGNVAPCDIEFDLVVERWGWSEARDVTYDSMCRNYYGLDACDEDYFTGRIWPARVVADGDDFVLVHQMCAHHPGFGTISEMVITDIGTRSDGAMTLQNRADGSSGNIFRYGAWATTGSNLQISRAE